MISACWIVKNEAGNIRKSIFSVKNCCDELIVVDTGSDDDTVRIAEACGARIAHFQWINDFSAAKNYALSLATGDFVIFLDADEQFDPVLTKEDKYLLYKIFTSVDADVLQLSRLELDKNYGNVLGETIVDRVMRRTEVHFENRIHEVPKNNNGTPARSMAVFGLQLIHTGYSEGMIKQKIKRNLAILQTEQQRLTDPFQLYLNAQYLLREYLALEDYDAAAEYCLYLLRHNEHLEAACKLYYTGMLQRLFHAMGVATKRRHRFCRKEIYDKLISGMRTNYPETREAAFAELYYQLLFQYREDRFLSEMEKLEMRLDALPPARIPECNQIETDIFTQAAEAAHLRGDTAKAKRWALQALNCAGKPSERLLLLAGKPIAPSSPDASPYRSYKSVVGAEGPDAIALFRAKANQLYAHMRYADILTLPDAARAALRDTVSAYYVAHACIMQGNYSEAYEIILQHLHAGSLDSNLLVLLLAVAEKSDGELAEKAGRQYTVCTGMLDEGMELSDVINTGAVYGADAKQQSNALRSMTPQQFLQGFNADKERPVSPDLLEAHERAAAVFKQNGCFLMAASSYMLLYAHGREPVQNIRKLIRLFKDAGNDELANHIGKTSYRSSNLILHN